MQGRDRTPTGALRGLCGAMIRYYILEREAAVFDPEAAYQALLQVLGKDRGFVLSLMIWVSRGSVSLSGVQRSRLQPVPRSVHAVHGRADRRWSSDALFGSPGGVAPLARPGGRGLKDSEPLVVFPLALAFPTPS